MPNFAAIPSVFPDLLKLRKSKTAKFKKIKYLKESTKLRYYQVIGALHMIMLDRMVLGDSTGLGKTLQVIAAYAFLKERSPEFKLLIVCPKSATFQWEEEFEKFTTGLTIRVLKNKYKKVTGHKARLLQYNDFKEDILVTNYSPILEEYNKFVEILSPNYLAVFDECQTFKSRGSKTHFAAKYIADHSLRTYGLSATIIKNGLEEVWGIYSVIVPGLFGNITNFKKNYCKQKLMDLVIRGKRRKIPRITGYKNLKKFKTVLTPYFLIRRKEEVASELPKLVSKKVILEMSTEQRKLYREALAGVLYEEKVRQNFYDISDKVRNGATDLKTLKKYEKLKDKYLKFLGPEGAKRGKLAALTYCQMVSNCPQMLDHPIESSKEKEFVRLMCGELLDSKVILYTRFRSAIPVLEGLCEKNGINYTQIHGGITDDLIRKQNRLKFQEDPKCRLIIITQAGSAALNLQAAGVMIFYDTPWSYGDLAQTIGRAQRIGSLQEHILILHLVNKTSIDEHVLKRVTEKKSLSDTVLGDTAAGALDFTGTDDSLINVLFRDIMDDAEKLK